MKKMISILFLAALLLSCFSLKKQAEEVPQNILFIAVDDLKPLLNCYGENQMYTPNFDRLAKEGILFTSAHVQQAVCGPSRASVMTCTYPDRTKVWDLETNFRTVSPELISMPEYLISKGYSSVAIGKIYHNTSSSPNHDGKSWTEHYFERPDSYQPVYGLPPFAFWMNPKMIPQRDSLISEAQSAGIGADQQMDYAMARLRPATEQIDGPDDMYPDGLFAREAIARLERLKKAQKPFFLALGFIKPHLPFNAPKKYWDLYDREKIDLEPFRELSKGTPEVAYHSFGELRAYSDIDDHLNVGHQMPEDKQRELIHGYMACVSYIDAQIGKVLDALKANHLEKNTIIVLWGDHGFHLGDHTIWCKHSNFEQATRIPLMFAGPGVPHNVQSNHPVELLDVFPTLFDLAHIPLPSQAEGRSLVPLFSPKTVANFPRDFAISQYPRGKKIMGYSIRTDQYRYTEWYKYEKDYTIYGTNSARTILAKELYDYATDPDERVNYSGHKKYEKEEEALRIKLANFLAQNNQK